MHMKACGNVYQCRCGIRLCSLGALKRHCKQFGHEPTSLEPTPETAVVYMDSSLSGGLDAAAAAAQPAMATSALWAGGAAGAAPNAGLLTAQASLPLAPATASACDGAYELGAGQPAGAAAALALASTQAMGSGAFSAEVLQSLRGAHPEAAQQAMLDLMAQAAAMGGDPASAASQLVAATQQLQAAAAAAAAAPPPPLHAAAAMLPPPPAYPDARAGYGVEPAAGLVTAMGMVASVGEQATGADAAEAEAAAAMAAAAEAGGAATAADWADVKSTIEPREAA